MSKRCVIYCRVSTAEQAAPGHHSLDAQETLCKRYADAHTLQVIEVLRDEGYSGRTTRRPGLRRLLEYTGTEPPQPIDAILVQDTSRMGRDSTEYMLFRRDLRQRSIELIAVTQPNIDSSPEGMLVDTIMAGINQYQSEEKARRVSIAMMKKFEDGWWPSRAPIGYLNVVRDGHHILAPDPERFPLMQLAYREYATGRHTQEGLLRILTEQGLRDHEGRNITRGGLNKMLANPFAWGLMRWDGQERQGRHEPLTDRQTWEHCQHVTAEHNKYVSRARKHTFLLAGLTTCALCRAHHTRTVNRKKRKRYVHCQGRARCPQPYIPENALEAQVADLVQRIELSDAFITAVIERIHDVFERRATITGRKKAILLREQTLAEEKRRAAEHKLLAGVLTDEAFGRLVPEITVELDRLKRRLDDLEGSRRIDTSVLREVFQIAKDIPAAYARSQPAMRRRYIEFFFTEFIVKDRTIVRPVPTPFFATLLQFDRVRTKGVWQPSVNTNLTAEQYVQFVPWLSEQLVKLRGLVLHENLARSS
mgnify:CR=1 FL=1